MISKWNNRQANNHDNSLHPKIFHRNLKPHQPQSPTPIEEDFDPSPTFTNDGKRQYQQDDTRNNKKQKLQENAILLTITETPLPQLITLSDPVPTPTDPLLETLAIPTPPQIILQPHIIESTTNETTVNYPNQEQTTTRTHVFEHHSPPTITYNHQPPPPPQEVSITQSQLLDFSTASQLALMQFPENWSQMSRRARKYWFQNHKTNSQLD